MAMSPLLREECRGEQCAWWFEAEPAALNGCTIVELPDRLNDVVDNLAGAENEPSRINQQLSDGISVNSYAG